VITTAVFSLLFRNADGWVEPTFYTDYISVTKKKTFFVKLQFIFRDFLPRIARLNIDSRA